MGKDLNDDGHPLANAVFFIGLIVLGFLEVIGVAADASKQIWRDREENPGAWRGLDHIYLPLLAMDVEKERWRKRLDSWSGEEDKGDESAEERPGAKEPKGWPEAWDMEKMMDASLVTAMDEYERMLEKGTAGHGWHTSRLVMGGNRLQEGLRKVGIAPSDGADDYERELGEEGLSLDGKKFWPEKIERSVQEKTGNRRTVVFTVTARDKKGCSLGFTAEVVVTFEYSERRGNRKGFFTRALGKPDSYGWSIVNEWGASRKKEVSRKIKCPNVGGTSSLLRDKPFPRERINPAPAMRAQRGMHRKMRRAC
jgi:hypothetical protein